MVVGVVEVEGPIEFGVTDEIEIEIEIKIGIEVMIQKPITVHGITFVAYDEAIIQETIQEDCYRLHKVCGPPRKLLVVDGGACFGDFALWAAALGAFHVVAVEPVPEIFEKLRANLKANPKLAKHITPVWGAIGFVGSNSPAVRRIASIEGNIGGGHFTPHPGVEVPVRSLQEICNTFPDWVAICSPNLRLFLKLDVEGAEREIFHPDNKRLLSACDFISMEWHNHDGAVYALALAAMGFKTSLTGCGSLWDPTIGRGMVHAWRRGDTPLGVE